MLESKDMDYTTNVKGLIEALEKYPSDAKVNCNFCSIVSVSEMIDYQTGDLVHIDIDGEND